MSTDEPLVDEERKQLVEEAATRFAELFLSQVLWKRQQEIENKEDKH